METTDLIRLCAAGVIFIACAAILWKLWKPARRATLLVEGPPIAESFTSEDVAAHPVSLIREASTDETASNIDASGLFVVDPVLLASETQAWLDQDWFGLNATSDSLEASVSESSTESSVLPTPVGADEHETAESSAATEALEHHSDGTSEELEPAMADTEVEPWQDAAIASIPSKKEAKKAARAADQEAAREAARLKKQLKRDAKSSRKKQPSIPVFELEEEFSLAPFTALPLKPPSKREVRKSVRAAAKEVKAVRRQEREAEKAAQAAQRELREAEKAAAEEAVRKKLAAVAAAAAEVAAAEQASKMSAWEAAAVEMGAAKPAPLPNPLGEAVEMAPPALLAAQPLATPSAWESAAASTAPAPMPVVAPAPVVAVGDFFAPAPVAAVVPASQPDTPAPSSSSGSDAWQSSAMAGFWETAPVSKPVPAVADRIDINKFGLPEPLPLRRSEPTDGPHLQG